MNPEKLRNILNLYKLYFPQINREESYKWRAVKCFQDNWNINAENFPQMLAASLKEVGNLLDSGQYFPKRMMVNNAYVDSESIKKLFVALYKDNTDLIERIKLFRTDFKLINHVNFPDKQNFQDDRAVMVYLTLKYPERYFFYKYKMFREFVELIDYPFKPLRGKIETVLQYETLCELVRSEIVKDTELLELHAERISRLEYNDVNYHILTQDVIYASTIHIEKFRQNGAQTPISIRLTEENINVTPISTDVSLNGQFVNYLEIAKENKRIGDLGELLVLEYEIEKLKRWGFKGEVVHSSKRFGDGLGYDIESFDEKGNPMFIEVKTTRGDYSTPFFITANELLCSNKKLDNYYLYRLYNYDSDKHAGTFYSRCGSLENLCNNPIVFKAVIT